MKLMLTLVLLVLFVPSAWATNILISGQTNTSAYYAGGGDCGHYDWQYTQIVDIDNCISNVYSNYGYLTALTFGGCNNAFSCETQVQATIAPFGYTCQNTLYGSVLAGIQKTWDSQSQSVIPIGGHSMGILCSGDLNTCAGVDAWLDCDQNSLVESYGTPPTCYL